MNLTEAIHKGREKYAKAKKDKMHKAILRPMTSILFIKIFNNQFEKEGYGIPAQITKKDKGMLNHLVNHLKENLDTVEIVNLAKSIVIKWKDIESEHVFTLNNKKLTMPTRPSLRAFLLCKNDIISFLTGDTKEQKRNEGGKENPNIMPI